MPELRQAVAFEHLVRLLESAPEFEMPQQGHFMRAIYDSTEWAKLNLWEWVGEILCLAPSERVAAIQELRAWSELPEPERTQQLERRKYTEPQWYRLWIKTSHRRNQVSV